MSAPRPKRTIELDYTPRSLLLPYHQRTQRWACLVCHRRFGKTVGVINDQIKKAITLKRPDGRIGYIAPYRGQAKEVAWNYLKKYSMPLWAAEPSESELRVTLLNGASIRLYGGDNPDAIRGGYFDDVVMDEFADQRAGLWGNVVRPMLADREGSATFIGSPKGKNEFWEIHRKAQRDPSWFSMLMPASESGILPQSELDAMLVDMGVDRYMQEVECFKPDAIVVCADQAKPISDVRVGDCVLTHRGRFKRVTALLKQSFAGQMVCIDSFGSRKIVCTPEHPIYVCDPANQTYAWKKAIDITKGDWLVTPRMDVRANGIISEPLAKVIAWYVSEGNVSSNRVTFSIGAHEPEFVADVCNALDACGQEYDLKTANAVTMIGINSVVLGDFLVGQCGSLAANKRLPLALLRGHEEVVWNALINGDGCIHEPKIGRTPVYAYTTTSIGLAQQVQILGTALGYTGTYTVRASSRTEMPDGRFIVGGESYCVQMRKTFAVDRFVNKTRSAKNGGLGLVKAVSSEEYIGDVYNLSVAQDESYTVNGRAVHNCSFEAAIHGAFYAEEMRRASDQGRIRPLQVERAVRVHTAWDLGFADSTAIWFIQCVGTERRLIDYYETSGVGLDHYAEVLDSKKRTKANPDGYLYGTHYLPHDIAVHELTSGQSRKDTLEGLGIEVTIVPPHAVLDGINAVRRMLDRSFIDPVKCERGLEALRNYKREYDEKLKDWKSNARHDWTSHGADALRMFAVAHDEPDLPKQEDRHRRSREASQSAWAV
jgi:hypothetical protein